MDRKPWPPLVRKHEAELKQLGVQHLYLFGSTARDEARADADVDLFFDHERSCGIASGPLRCRRCAGTTNDVMKKHVSGLIFPLISRPHRAPA
jgi:predicted nucleotidyltransferase